jgi:GMP synthase (glutamine-hydrolysing)
VLHWHGDTFDLPAGAVHLASTPVCANQAFAVGRSTLALQFHPEVTAQEQESWLVGHAHELAHTPGATPTALRAAARRADGGARRARAFFTRWLDGLPDCGDPAAVPTEGPAATGVRSSGAC